MNSILLVFFTLNIHNPSTYTGPEISDRMFKLHSDCAEFVNTVAQLNVVDRNYEFEFASADGLIFKGGCYTKSEWSDKKTKYGII